MGPQQGEVELLGVMADDFLLDLPSLFTVNIITGRMVLTHRSLCSAGNQPHLEGLVAPNCLTY